MILNKFLDKTIEAAKQSAMQMYGYDLAALKDILHEENAKEDASGSDPGYGDERTSLSAGKRRADVVFERSEKTNPTNRSSAVESKLTAIRKYAARQTASDVDEIKSWNRAAKTLSPSLKSDRELRGSGSDSSSKQLYSRKDIRGRGRRSPAGKTTADKNPIRNGKTAERKKKDASAAIQHKQPLQNFDNTVPAMTGESQPDGSSIPEKKEHSLHQRLDRLESLMHLTLSSDDLSHASHPAYHKLLHKGVPQRLISGWFHALSDQGVHPKEQQELFDSKLSQIICETVAEAEAGSPEQLLFFTGRSGAGKTQLIMKLSQHSYSMGDKKIAVASLEPSKGKNRHFYTILAPFCRDYDIPYYQLKSEDELDTLHQKWKQFDHILVDTPSMETMDEGGFKQLMSIKQQLQAEYPSETHYVVNTSVYGAAFHDPLAARIHADHLALTHIDKSNKWGQTVQLLTQTDYSLRFISSGEAIPDDLDIFDPERFAEKLLI